QFESHLRRQRQERRRQHHSARPGRQLHLHRQSCCPAQRRLVSGHRHRGRSQLQRRRHQHSHHCQEQRAGVPGQFKSHLRRQRQERQRQHHSAGPGRQLHLQRQSCCPAQRRLVSGHRHCHRSQLQRRRHQHSHHCQ